MDESGMRPDSFGFISGLSFVRYVIVHDACAKSCFKLVWFINFSKMSEYNFLYSLCGLTWFFFDFKCNVLMLSTLIRNLLYSWYGVDLCKNIQ